MPVEAAVNEPPSAEPAPEHVEPIAETAPPEEAKPCEDPNHGPPALRGSEQRGIQMHTCPKCGLETVTRVGLADGVKVTRSPQLNERGRPTGSTIVRVDSVPTGQVISSPPARRRGQPTVRLSS
jgi:hypothetical protein